MARYFLSMVAVEGFRGINNEGDPLVLKFRTDAVNSIFAPNALGKSSIFDALSYAIRGHIPKLDSLPAADDAESYYTNRFHSAHAGMIELAFQPDDGGVDIRIVVTRSQKGVRRVSSPSGWPDPEAFLRTLDGDAVLLDHRTFDAFVEDTPLRRGRTFSGLLGLGRLSEYRQALEVLSHARNVNTDLNLDSLRSEYSNEVAAIDAALTRIRTAYLGFIGSQLPEPLDTTAVSITAKATLLSIPIAAPFATTSFADVVFGAIRAAVKSAEGGDDHERLSVTLTDIAVLERFAASAAEMTDHDDYGRPSRIGERRSLRPRENCFSGCTKRRNGS
jgi:hypothetical protein